MPPRSVAPSPESYVLDDVEIRIDPSTLRDAPVHRAALEQWALAHPDDPRIVPALRMLGRLDTARTIGRRLVASASDDPILRAVHRTRLAHVLHWQGRFSDAEEQFALAAEETGLGDPTARSGLLVLASVYQHRAKARMDAALACRGAERTERLDAAHSDAAVAVGIRERLEAPTELQDSARAGVPRISALSADGGDGDADGRGDPAADHSGRSATISRPGSAPAPAHWAGRT